MKIKLVQPLSPRGKPYIIEDFDSMPEDAVKECRKMIKLFEADGHNCCYIKHLSHLKNPPPILELKSRIKGGVKGGSRVYFFWYDGSAVLCAAETKRGKKADLKLIERVVSIYREGRYE